MDVHEIGQGPASIPLYGLVKTINYSAQAHDQIAIMASLLVPEYSGSTSNKDSLVARGLWGRSGRSGSMWQRIG